MRKALDDRLLDINREENNLKSLLYSSSAKKLFTVGSLQGTENDGVTGDVPS